MDAYHEASAQATQHARAWFDEHLPHLENDQRTSFAQDAKSVAFQIALDRHLNTINHRLNAAYCAAPIWEANEAWRAWKLNDYLWIATSNQRYDLRDRCWDILRQAIEPAERDEFRTTWFGLLNELADIYAPRKADPTEGWDFVLAEPEAARI